MTAIQLKREKNVTKYKVLTKNVYLEDETFPNTKMDSDVSHGLDKRIIVETLI